MIHLQDWVLRRYRNRHWWWYIKPLHMISIYWALTVIKISLKNLTSLLCSTTWCFNLLNLFWHLCTTFGFTLFVVVTLVYKEKTWRWCLPIKTCRCVIRRKKFQHQILGICWFKKVESIKMNGTHNFKI